MTAGGGVPGVCRWRDNRLRVALPIMSEKRKEMGDQGMAGRAIKEYKGSHPLLNMTNPIPVRAALTLLALISAPCVLSAATTDYATAVLANNPYAYYRLGESSGTAAVDSSGNNRNGSYVNSPTLSVAGDGTGGDTAVTFNGTNQRVLTGLAGFNSLGHSSMEFVLSTTTTTFNLALAGTANAGSSTAFGIYTNSNLGGTQTVANSTRIFLRDDAGTNSLSAAFVSPELYSGSYTHLVITFDSTLGRSGLKVYINGTAVTVTTSSTGTGIGATSATSTFSNAFGYAPTLSANNNRGTVASFMPATFDEAAFYTTILSAGDVSAHYQSLTSIPEPSTVAALAGLSVAAFVISRRRRAQA